MLRKPLGLAIALALLAGCASDNGFHYTPPAQTLIAPEAASGWTYKQGWQGHDGLALLINQGRVSFKLWFGQDAPPYSELRNILLEHLKQAPSA